ncbi:MAG: hypothetical protein ACLFRY_01965 [Spirochaetia bacterium]
MNKMLLRRLIIGAVVLAAVVAGIVVFLVADEGDVGISAVLSYMASPVIIPILAEFLVIAFLVISFIISKERRGIRRRLRFASLGFAAGLVAFYFVIPRIPVDMAPNHPDEEWDSGEVVHILPGVSSDRILLKTSFDGSVDMPVLEWSAEDGAGAKRTVRGKMTGTEKTNYAFDLTGLSPNTRYRLRLLGGGGRGELCDPWEISTLPGPGERPESLRVLVFTCPGGHDATRTWFGFGQIPLKIRQKLLNRALDFEPHIMVSLGDQIYYDLEYGVSAKVMGDSRRARRLNGRFDKTLPVLGTENERVLKKAVGEQVAYLFGTACRSTPSFFILDDHDYFVNDDARKEDERQMQLLLAWMNPFVAGCVTLPPEPFHLEMARTAQNLYLPEFLPDPTRPGDLPGSGASDRSPGVSEVYGTLRYGDLLEGAFIETRRFLTLDGEDAVLLPKPTENWLTGRMRAATSRYFITFSGLSFGWCCAKWISWYPDVKVKTDDGVRLSTEEEKYLWQEGWFLQHNRILEAAKKMTEATPLFVCGDIHHQSAGHILRSGSLDLSTRPVATMHPGALSVDKGGYPSKGIRGIKAQPPTALEVREDLPSFEKAGFVIMDVDREKITARFYAWRNGTDPVEAIDTLEPHYIFEAPARR